MGSEELVRKTAAEHNIPLDGIELVNCTETIEMCDEPVSYTHLDVYKRQVPIRSIHCFSTTH